MINFVRSTTAVINKAGGSKTGLKESKTPFVVFIHGMWHGSWYWRESMMKLNEAGINSIAVDLKQGPSINLSSHVNDVINVLDSFEPELWDKHTLSLVAHSQGGIIAQSMINHPTFQSKYSSNLSSICLCGTIPLSPNFNESLSLAFGEWGLFGSPLTRILKQIGLKSMWNYAWYGILSKPTDVSSMFLLPSTPLDSDYAKKILSAPCDGHATWMHFMYSCPSKPFITNKKGTKVLIFGAQQDGIYPPSPLKPLWRTRFPSAKFKESPNQAHCFMDPGYESSFIEPLVEFIKE